MIQRLDIDNPPASEPRPDASTAGGDRVRAWLDVLSKLLPVREADRQSIRDELEEHLRERVRDLMVGGRAEDEAVRTAIDELGEAAELARRYQRASRTARRRWTMNLTAMSLGAGVILAGVFTIAPGRQPLSSSMFQEPPQPHVATLEHARLDVEEDMTMEAFAEALAADTQLAVSIEWSALEDIGLGREETLGISGRDLSVAGIFAVLAERTEGCFAWRLDEELLRINDAEHFDRAEQVLVVYDVADVIAAVSSHDGINHESAVELVGDVIVSFVEPEAWEDMGGIVAHYRYVGGKLFVNAPPRMHRQLEWILLQLVDGNVENGLDKRRSGADAAGAR